MLKSVRTPRVVTIGGGHGQAMLIGALVRLRCSVTALVSVADDGGCSGRLREETGMAPPGDVRRCLLAMSTRPALAARFDERLPSDDPALTRSAGNLVLAEMWQRLGRLQLAVDWAGELLGVVGRVVPIADTPGVLEAYDLDRGRIQGESSIERDSARAIVVNVAGPTEASPEAKRALAEADLVFIGPGSLVGSTLAALTTGDLGAAIVASPGRLVLVRNLGDEPGHRVEDQERVVRDHLVIRSGGETVTLDVLAHDDDPAIHTRADGSKELRARLRLARALVHDPALVTSALATYFGLEPMAARSSAEDPSLHQRFEEVLASSARSRSR